MYVKISENLFRDFDEGVFELSAVALTHCNSADYVHSEFAAIAKKIWVNFKNVKILMYRDAQKPKNIKKILKK